jgi:uncharacterized protein (DUF58 family)
MATTTKELLKKVRHIELKTRGLVNHVFSGEYHSVFKGRGMEFAEVREYQPGDDIRDIDWNVTARFDRPYVKVFEEERELTVMLVVDLSGSQYFGTVNATKRQIAVEISAILAFSALKNNDKVGLIIFSDKIEKFVPPKKSRSHALRIIRELLSFEPEGKGTDVNSALEFLNKAHKKRAIVFLISDFNDDGYDRSLRIVGKRHDLIGVEISDEREQTIPRIGLARFRDPETGREEVVDAGSRAFLTFYRKRKRELRESRQRLFNTSRLDRVSVNTRDSYISPLVGFFRTRGKRW